ncbi:MAG TPA: glycosyltransferase [Polyangiaceae bacterium]|nr:glycosyltransferase [Polyangiaceae bacterium]
MTQTPLSIAHVLTSLCVGGGERVALLLGAKQVKDGHRVMVVSLEEPPEGALTDEFTAAGVTVERVPKGRGFDMTLSTRLWRTFRKARVDVVHTHNPLPLIYAAPAARAAGARVVHTKHGPHPDAAHRLWLRRAGAAATDAFVAVSEITADFAREIREVAPEKLHVIVNATDLSHFRPDHAARRATRALWGMDDDVFIVGTVGRMAEVKNHVLLVRAVAPLLGEETRLVIAGDGPERARVELTAEELGVRPWLTLLGETRDVADALRAFDVFALSSKVEGLPLVIAEAMATGLPVVSTAVGGVPTVVADGVTGFLVPEEDERALRERLRRLHDDPALAAELGTRARDVALERFSDERMAREYVELYAPPVSPHGG